MIGVSTRRALFALLSLSAALEVASLLLALHTSRLHPSVPLYDYLMEGTLGGWLVLALGVLLAARRPEHRVTWVFVGMAILGGLQQALGGYAVEALVIPSELPFGPLALASSSIAQAWFVFAFLLMVNLFPTGRPLPGGWRLVVWALVPLAAVGALDILTAELELGSLIIPPLIERPSPRTIDFFAAGFAGFAIVGTVTHVVVRFSRSGGLERQQLKWFTFTLAVGIAVLVGSWTEDDTIGALLWTVVPFSILASVALAILRYRLYDIDRIISRTVSYALVVGALGVMVLGLVALLAVFLPSDDPLVVAVSTLAVAALFNPVRHRVQRLVDRRFNRSRYETELVIEHFARSLRSQLDAEAVVDGWLGVVAETMQPSSVDVWVRGARGSGTW